MLTFLDTLFLQPLLSIYDWIFQTYLLSIDPGPRLVFFSVMINLALTPVYAQMEKRSRGLREKRAVMGREIERMKKHFSGRERYYYIRAVHRQHRYHPLSELFGSADLFVQILVFATVYRYLSGVEGLAGHTFGPVRDISKPDGLLWGVNLLPLLMTAINAAAVFAYVEDRAKRAQALVLSFIFLILLYSSPAALVIYWTTNNVFSLVRSVIQKKLGLQFARRYAGTRAFLASQR